MNMYELEVESIDALPTRIETDTNAAGVGISQGNLGIQIGVLSGQFMAQGNFAGVSVTQINV